MSARCAPSFFASLRRCAERQNNASLQKMMAAMSFEPLLKKAGDAVPQELIRNINEQLQKIRKS